MNTATTEEMVLTPEVALPDQIALCEQEMEKIKADRQRIFILQKEAQTKATKSGLGGALQRLASEGQRFVKIYSALQAGYSQITIPERKDWATGYPKETDPRPHKWTGTSRARNIDLCLILLAACLFIIGMLLDFFIPLLLSAIGVLALGACYAIALDQLREVSTKALRVAGFPRHERIYFLQQKLPPEVMTQYQQARSSRLFDSIRVFAPREAFSRAAKFDPIMYGIIGDRTFLIAQWNLGDDLKELNA